MYTAEQVSSAPGSNTEFHPARRVIRWKELKGMQYLADGAMCSCYTAQLAGHGTVVVKKPSRRSSEVSRSLVVEHAVVGVRRRDVPCAVVPQLHATGLVNNMVHFFPPTARSQFLPSLSKLRSRRRAGSVPWGSSRRCVGPGR